MTNPDKVASAHAMTGGFRLPASVIEQRQWIDTAAVLARWLLGALFIYMGLSKALHPADFLKLAREYHMTTSPLLLNSIAAALPWFEVFCGLLLLAGIAVRGTVLVLTVLLICFSLAVLRRALAISAHGLPFAEVKFDCGCGNGEVFAWKKLLENSLLILLSLWLLAGRGRRLCARFSLFGRRQPASEAP
jgi:putative oxidoreductase